MRCALHGADPNWGRMLARAGTCGVGLDPERVAVWVGPTRSSSRAASRSRARAPRRAPRWREHEVEIRIDLARGRRARRAVRVVALARVRDVQRGVHDVTRTAVVKLGGNATLDCVPIVALHGARGPRLRRARRRPADQRAGARARRRAALRRRPSRDRRADAGLRARRASRAVSAELCARARGGGPAADRASAPAPSTSAACPSSASSASPSRRAPPQILEALGRRPRAGRRPARARRRGGTMLNVNADDARRRHRDRARAPTSSSSSPTCPACSTSGAPCSRTSPPRSRRRARPAACCPKLEACAAALLGGVARVSIGVAGTVVTP